MNKIIFYFLIGFYSTTFYSQNNLEVLLKRADSLENVQNYKESILIWKQLLTNQKKENIPYYSLRYFYAKGGIEGVNNENSKAVIFYEKATSFIPKIKATEKNKTIIGNLYSDLYLTTGYSGDWEKALKHAKIGYNYVLKNTPKDIDAVSFIQDIGYIQNELREYAASIVSYEEALKLVYKFYSKDYERLGLLHNQLAIAYSDSQFHNQSLYHYTKGFEFHKKENGIDKSYIVNSANNVIWENLDYGDDKKAKETLDYLNKNFYNWFKEKGFATINRRDDKLGNIHFKTLLYLSNLRYSIFKKNYDVATKYYDSIVSTFNKYPKEKRNSDNTLILAMYSYEDNFKNSLSNDKSNSINHINFNKKIIEVAERMQSIHDQKVALLRLAITLDKYKKYDESIESIEKLKKINATFFNASHFTSDVLQASILNKLNKNQQSRKLLLISYQKLLEKQTNIKSLKQLKYADFKKFNSSAYIRNTINSAKVYFEIYEKEKQKEDLIIANNLYFIASDIFAEFYQKGKYNYSLNAFNKEIASGLLETQMLINPNDKVKIKAILNRIENNSSQHLWNVFELKSNQNLKVPASLIQEYNQLVFERNSILSSQELNGKSPGNEQSLVILEKKIQSKISKINQYDNAYQKFKSSDFNVDKIQNQLTANQLMIKYVVTDKKTFAFAIKKDGINLLDIGKTDFLKKSVSEYSKSINAITVNYDKSAKFLHSKLIEPVLKNQSISSIIFVPEDYLNALSFETLESKSGKFLVQNYFISYAYSLKLWDFLQDNNSSNKQGNQFVSFAPNYSKIPKSNQVRGMRRGNLFDLAEAKTEAQTISNLFNGKLFLNEEATKNNFLQATTTYNFHHLAMHSLLEDDYSKSSLVFTNNQKVYFDELYQLNFPSKMVVLSACSTGLGTQESGEGIMSLSRALAYSGVKSSVYSLWQVPDKETSEIMISFYENLKKGQPKDEALANAKTTFISKNPMKNHPFYWAGFVINGDVSPIVSNSIWMIYLGIGLFVLALFFFFRKKLF